MLQSSLATGFSTSAPEAGFLAAVAGRLAERVMTVDRYKTLVQLAQQRFAHLGLGNVIARQADGLKGVSGEGSFDRIIATCAFDGCRANSSTSWHQVA
jgi:protein-L-isoaspartate(D-aspartate) O-methyltransferase